MSLWILLLLQLKIQVIAQTWSTWTSCSHPETCQNKTELNCDNGRGIQCSQYGIFPYRITLNSNCNGNCDVFDNSQWEGSYIFLSCRGNCYDSVIIHEYFCKINQACRQHRYNRCYNEQTCRGIWKESSSPCSSSCGGGTRTVIRTCVNQTTGQKSSDCNGTFYGTNNQINKTQPCHSHACPTWSSWSHPTSCGNQFEISTSTCMYNGTASLLCKGSGNNSTRQRIQKYTIITQTANDYVCGNIHLYGNETKMESTTKCNSTTTTSNEGACVGVAVGSSILVLIIVIIVSVVLWKKINKRTVSETNTSNTIDNFTSQSKTKSNENEDSKSLDYVNVYSSGEHKKVESITLSTNVTSSEFKEFPPNKEKEACSEIQTTQLEEHQKDSTYVTMNSVNQHQNEYENFATIHRKPR